MEPEEETLDTRGRNITLAVFGAIVVLITGLVINNYRIKASQIAAMRGYNVDQRVAAARAMMARGDVAEQIQGEPASVRMVAVRALEEVGDSEAAKKLIPLMKDSDHPVREFAIQALMQLGPAAALEAAVEALGDTDDNIKQGAERVCASFEGRAIDPLIGKLGTGSRVSAANALHAIASAKQAYKTEVVRKTIPFLDVPPPGREATYQSQYDEDTQNNAIALLDWQAAVEAVDPLIAKLNRRATRRAAVGALGRIGDPRATAPLLRLLPEDETLRVEIVLALGQIGSPEAVPDLVEHGLGGVSETVRQAAADALRRIGGPAVPTLINALKDANAYRRAGAASALGGMKDQPAAIQAAVLALSDPDEKVREAAARALGESGSAAVILALIRAFDDPSGRAAAEAARSAAAFGTRATGSLIAALADPRPAHVYWATEALLLIGPQAVRPLTAALQDAEPHIARWAAKLLGDLGDPSAVAALRRVAQSRQEPEVAYAARTALRRLGETGES
ncbi:MAG: HEAT repeat domain-containing protein [Armatimonadetes bacterium]|nr:HEAT repeat domain-containing protein [Armatimonadota bacterium]